MSTISNKHTLFLAFDRTNWYSVVMKAGEILLRLEDIDIDELSIGDAQAAVRELSIIRGATARLEARIARRITTLNHGPASDHLNRQGRTSRRAAERAERRAGLLGESPALDAALGAGKIGTEHADTVTNAAARLDEVQRRQLIERDQDLADLAASRSPEQFRSDVIKIVDEITNDDGLSRDEQQREAATFKMGIDRDTGMHWFRGELCPEDGNRLRKRIAKRANELRKRPDFARKRGDQIDAAAVVDLVCGARSTPTANASTTDAVVLIPYGVLTGDPSAHAAEYSDGTPMPAAAARRHACDANIIPVVLGGDSMPTDVGRARRLATREQRHALRSMYRTCAIDGCDTHFDLCHIHHLQEWDHDGLTDMDNLLPLCSFHHHRAHEGRWRLELDPSTRHLTVSLPNGSIHSTSLPDRVAEAEQSRPAA